MNKKRIIRWIIGAVALILIFFQPIAAIPATLPFNTVATVEAAVSTKPGKVVLKSIKATSYNRIRINWKKTTGATHYRIYYKVPGGRWKWVKTVRSNVTSYTHISSKKNPIKCGQKYTYTVRAYNSRSKKAGSYNTRGLTTKTVPTTVSLRNIKRNSNNTVTISWKKAYGGNYYRVYRKTSGTGWKMLANVKSSSFSYTDKKPVKGKKNIYTVRCYNSSTRVAGRYNSKGLSVTVGNTSSSSRTPGTPALLKISSSAYNKITISWKKASNATHYRIFYKVPGGSWKQVATVRSNVTRYTHTSSAKCPIKLGQKYTYTVRAYNSSSKKWGRYDSRGLTVTPALGRPTVSDWKKTHDSATCNCNPPHDGVEYTISWKRVPGASGYQVYYGQNDNGQWYTGYSNTTNLKFSLSFSHINMNLKAKVRAFRTVNGRRIYGSWSTMKTKTIRYTGSDSSSSPNTISYNSILQEYKRVADSNFSSTVLRQCKYVNSSAWNFQGSTKNVYYQYIDLAKDGTSELIIAINQYGKPYTILDIYGMSNGKPVRIIENNASVGYRSRYYITTDNRIKNCGSGGALNTEIRYYKLPKNSVSLKNDGRYIYDGWNGDRYTYINSRNVSTSISKSVYDYHSSTQNVNTQNEWNLL